MLFDRKDFISMKVQRSPHNSGVCVNAERGYNTVYHNKIGADINYVNYDRNVKQIDGS